MYAVMRAPYFMKLLCVCGGGFVTFLIKCCVTVSKKETSVLVMVFNYCLLFVISVYVIVFLFNYCSYMPFESSQVDRWLIMMFNQTLGPPSPNA